MWGGVLNKQREQASACISAMARPRSLHFFPSALLSWGLRAGGDNVKMTLEECAFSPLLCCPTIIVNRAVKCRMHIFTLFLTTDDPFFHDILSKTGEKILIYRHHKGAQMFMF